MKSEPITVDQVGCARCGGEGHEGLTFEPLASPVSAAMDGRGGMMTLPVPFTHWAPCPTNGEPILLAVTRS